MPYPYGYNQTPISNSNLYFNVNGYEGARQFAVAPNQTVLLVDSMEPYLYMKSANQMGQTTIKTFRLTEVAENPEKQAEMEKYASLEARLKALEEREVKKNG